VVDSGGFDVDSAAASRLLGRPAHVIARLSGGAHAVTTTVTDGANEYVLRRFPAGDGAVTREIAVLPRLIELGELVPRLVAFDDSEAEPAILTQKVHGTPPPPDLPTATIACELGKILARIHVVSCADLPPELLEPPVPGDSAIARRAQRDWAHLDRGEQVLLHRDFWCGNTLWDGGTVTGVVDWSSARSGPRGIDLAWCRQDLVLLGDRVAADSLVSTYQAASGHAVHDIAAWDRHAAARAEPVVEEWAVNYAGIDRAHLTGTVLRDRLDDWINDLLVVT
jgi:aminoglycoside phosphotransferase (APT) family kinase protein